MIKHDLTNTTLNISQMELINNTTQIFNKDVKSLVIFNTPYKPRKVIVRNQETDKKIPEDLHKRYRRGAGSLLYLVKQSRTELSNAVRELSTCMDEANMIHYKFLLPAIKYVIDTKDYCYQMKPYRNINGPWELRGNSDAHYAGDNDTWKSVT